jgi:hypothetical protein
MGKKVCYVGHEDPKEKMTLKFMQSYCQFRLSEVSKAPLEVRQGYQKSWAAVQNNLYYFEWIKPGKMYIEDVMSLIEEQQEKLITETSKGFDLVIVDYPGVLMSRDLKATNDWQIKHYIYEQLKLLAKKHSWHSLTPIQTNREGFKINKESESLLDLDSIAQGFSIATGGDNVITINRAAADYQNRWVRFYIPKSRSNRNKTAFISETGYDVGRTHGLGYGCAIFSPDEVAPGKAIWDEEEVRRRLGYQHNAAEMASLQPHNVAYHQSQVPMDKKQTKTFDNIAPTKFEPSKSFSNMIFDANGNEIKKQ